ncbi:ATP-binding protein [Saccharothrix violaceirubra]|uniref:Sensor-like histidine kinase SenX3 n=1 Tax=Saccharothrix violaceirubra TaxID=413306 RepID=A0A7W7T459_9PSEU|nr:ATP-binding protein [Saccharothrix violaceirubra]MBB4966254.1 light-regulated signal transduction histidine kinase (bacteriophytochrome) [Saccharothrix violaceirubra]
MDERELAAETAFDLSVCLAEPIHRLNGIQSYGALLAVDAAGLVEVASVGCADVLGVVCGPGVPVVDVVGVAGWADVARTLAAPTGDRGVLGLTVAGGAFDVTVYRSDGRVVLEFEPPTAGRPFVFSQFYPSVRTALTRLQHERTVVDVCAAAVAEIRALTGYDRVVAYRFEGADGPGEVIAESVAEPVEPWLGLWFPATDIPPQARRLYERNWIRVIHDIDDVTVALDPPVLPDTGLPLDLSDSTLRTVSGFHLEYLRNIGVASSMSVSLLHEGRLWGLIACHGLAPRRLSAEVRAACEFFGVTLSLQLAAMQESEVDRARSAARSALSRLVAELDGEVVAAVAAYGDLLAALVPADAVVTRSSVVGGRPPGETALRALWEHVPPLAAGQVWSRDELPELAAYAEELSGVLVLGLDDDGGAVAWTRRERRAARTWAADPGVPVRLGPHGERLTPRGSSAVYREVTRGRCVPWTDADEAVARELGYAVTRQAARNSARLAALNDELRRANHDLDAFTHVAAHEMKEPLRGIATTAAFIGEDAEDLDPVTRRRLDTIQGLAQRMDELINSLLHFAQLGQADLRRAEVDLRAAVGQALEIAGPRLVECRVELIPPPPGTTVTADPDRLQEVLINLLVNAAKYARADLPRTVEVGVESSAVFVRDNGIGIPLTHQDEVFRLFRRLHPREARGGGHGAGLAIVARIVERHGGTLWLDSTPDAGTTVWFTLPGTG